MAAEQRVFQTYDCFHDRPHVEPYPDISGIGVHVGYLGTAYLVILILTGHYLIAFDPCKSPFKTADRVTFPSDDLGNGLIEQKWRPNQIDVSCLGLLRWPFPGRTRDERKPESQLRVAIHTSVLTLCDVQIATGTGILISAYASLSGEEGISVYHWLIVVYLAWFAHLTHLTGLTLLREHLNDYPSERNWRLIFIVLLFVLLFAAQIPTVYFGVAAYPSYTRCFFDVSTVVKRMELHDPHSRIYEFISAPAVVSMSLLLLSFLARILKGARCTSRNLARLRRWVSKVAQGAIHRLAGLFSSTPFFQKNVRAQQLWEALVVRPLVAVFLTARLYVDLCTSMLSEIFWLWIAVLWGTAHIVQLRRLSSLEVTEENRPTFGQIHPILLLVLPMIPAIIQFGAVLPKLWKPEKGINPDKQDGLTLSEKEDGDTDCPNNETTAPQSDLAFLLLTHHHDGNNGDVVPLYSAPWSTPTICLAKAQALFFTVAIFGDLFSSLDNLAHILASLIAWIVFMQTSACYIIIVLGLAARNVGHTWLPQKLRHSRRTKSLLSMDSPAVWWVLVLLVFAGYSLSPIWSSGRHAHAHGNTHAHVRGERERDRGKHGGREYSPVLRALYQDHFVFPVALLFQLAYTLGVGLWLAVRPRKATVRKGGERQVLD